MAVPEVGAGCCGDAGFDVKLTLKRGATPP